MIDTLIAWNDDIKHQLDKDVIEFLKIMPILKQKACLIRVELSCLVHQELARR